MSERIAEFGTASVVLVTFTADVALEQYEHDHALRFPIVRDPTRDTYLAFGLGRGSLMRVWGVKAARRYLEILRTNGIAGLRLPTEDTRQLGGDFVIDSQGRLAYGFWGDGPDERPSVDELVEAVRNAA